MSVSLDYLKTRAVGLKTHLIKPKQYEELINLQTPDSLINSIKSKTYENSLSKYYTPESKMNSFVLAINDNIFKSWALLTKYASGQFQKIIYRYQQVTDLFNYITIINRIDSTGDQSEIDPILIPGGSVDHRVWKEIGQSNTIRMANMKLKIINPDLWEIFDNYGLLTNSSFSGYLVSTIQMITDLSEVEETDSSNDLLQILLAEYMNKIIIRFAMMIGKTDVNQIEKVLENLEPWFETDLIIVDISFREESVNWLERIHQNIVDKIQQLQHHEENTNVIETVNPSHYEAIFSQMTIIRLKRQSRRAENPLYLIFYVMLKIKMEGQNLIWLMFCILNGFPKGVKEERVIFL